MPAPKRTSKAAKTRAAKPKAAAADPLDKISFGATAKKTAALKRTITGAAKKKT